MLRLRLSLSLDGYAAGPNQSVDNPLGEGGMRVHDWVFHLKAFREQHGMEGGDVNASSGMIEAANANVGATIMGRNMFGGGPGPWDTQNPWNGWWGTNPPYHHPVFVLTHHPRERLEMEGGNSFTFVTDGIESALRQARAAAGDKVIMLGGGADVARQYLNAGLVDEMVLAIAPVLLGAGERLFEGVTPDLHGMTLRQTVAAPDVVHMWFGR